MTTQFEWHFEQEGRPVFAGNQELPVAGRDVAALYGRLSLLATVFFVALALWLAFDQGRQQVARAQQAVTADALSSYRLAWDAAATDDAELLQLVLPVGEQAQATSPQRILKQGLPFDHTPLGLHRLAQPPAIVHTMLSLDLHHATVVAIQQYSTTLPAGTTTTITLEHATQLVRGPAGWTLDTLDEAFWGRPETIEQSRLTVTFPARDRELAGRLATDVNETLETLCARQTLLRCRAYHVVTARLDTTVRGLDEPAGRERRYGDADYDLVLPAPTLVGVPRDEPAYQALRHSYTAYTVAAFVAHVIGWECGDPFVLYQGLLEDRLVCVSP